MQPVAHTHRCGRMDTVSLCGRRRAYSLLEMMVTATILAISAAMALPMFTNDASLRVKAAATILASDIELAQTMTISSPADAVVIRFSPKDSSYWLAYSFDPDTPIETGSGEPYLVVLGAGRASSAFGVSLMLDQVDDDTIEFDSSGGLVSFTSTPHIELASNGVAITLTVAPMTGTITEQQGTIASVQADAKVGSEEINK